MLVIVPGVTAVGALGMELGGDLATVGLPLQR